MKKLILILTSILLLATCEKAPELIVTGQQEVSIEDDPYTFTVSVKANRAWSAKSSEIWVHVSPSNVATPTDDEVQVTISVDRNNSFDPRSTVVIFTAEDITKEIKVSQGPKPGMILPQSSSHYDVDAEGRKIDVEVQTNVDYDIVIDSDWVKLADSKALPSHHHTFEVLENGTRGKRTAKIEFINKAEGFDAKVEVVQMFYTILVSNTMDVSGRGWKGTFEAVGLDPDDYKVELQDRWLSFEKKERSAEGTRFYVTAAPLEEELQSVGRESRIMVYYKQLPVPDTLVVYQHALLPTVSFTTTEQIVQPPKLGGRYPVAFVFWGDGENDMYSAKLKHDYGSVGTTHTVTVELDDVKTFIFDEVKNEMTINMKELRK